jgi:hypothetical protein
MRRYVLMIVLPLLLMPFLAGAAGASQQGELVMQRWKVMDVCARQAQLAHPDYTAASNAARDAQMNACLNANNLPPRAPPLPAQGPR